MNKRLMVRLGAVAAVLAGFAVSSSFAADLTMTDKSFIKKAAEGGQFEIQASKLAESKSSNDAVKAFSEKMVTDHTAAGDELAQIASSKGITAPADPSLVQRGKLKALGALSGAHFDKNFADQAGVDAHKSTVALFQKEADKGSDPDLKAFATKTLPTLQGHLKMAEDLQAQLSQK